MIAFSESNLSVAVKCLDEARRHTRSARIDLLAARGALLAAEARRSMGDIDGADWYAVTAVWSLVEADKSRERARAARARARALEMRADALEMEAGE